MKKLALLLCLCLCLTGCKTIEVADEPHLETKPYVAEEQTSSTYDLTVYSYNNVTARLDSRIVPVTINSDQTREEAALNYLFSTPEYSFVRNSYGVPDYTLNVSEGVATVRIANRHDDNPESAFKNFTMHFSIVNTLCSVGDIDFVSVYAGDTEMAGDIYIGPSGFVEQNITEYYSEVYGGGKRNANTEGQKSVTLYYGDKAGMYIIPEKAQIFTNPSNHNQTAEAILSKIKNTPSNSNDLMPVISKDMKLNWIDIRNGRLTMDFNVSPAAPQVKSQSVACAALYYTFKGIYPSINDAAFSINGVPIETDEIQGGIVGRDTLSSLVGNAVTLYMPGEDLKTLYPVKKYLRSSSGISVVEILKALEDGDENGGENQLLSPFFEDLSVNDIINARVVNDVAIVNFDTGFYDSVRTMTKEQETALVYSIVNTLTTREQINRVQFLINNQSFDTINGHIYYTNPLYTNPGIIFKG